MDNFEAKTQDIRKKLIEAISKNGGHLASNLGVVELTLALDEVFSFEEDIVLFDVGHQSYVYKILTAREEKFFSIRKKGGIGPFMDPEESPYDNFISGHAGTALGAAVGFAKAYPEKRIIVVVGDASMANGHSLEAINYIGGNQLKNIIIIMNNNEMSIGKNVGSLSNYYNKVESSTPFVSLVNDMKNILAKLKLNKDIEHIDTSINNYYMPLSIIENLGFKYFGSIDGHNMEALIKVFRDIKNTLGPIFVTVNTIKGKGYSFAEEDKEKFHGVGPFDIDTGLTQTSSQNYSNIFGEKIVEIAKNDEKILALSAGMIKGTGLDKFSKHYPERTVDTGISEGFLVTYAAALAKGGLKPYVCIYSTFLQRAFSQIIHDVFIQNLAVRFIVDRSGIVGEDGKTHNGFFDTALFMSLKNFIVLFPTTVEELNEALEISKNYDKGPMVIKIAKSNVFTLDEKYNKNYKLEIGKWNIIKKGTKTAFIAVGPMLKSIVEIDDELIKKGIDGTIISAASLKPFDEKCFLDLVNNYDKIIIIEENYKINSFSSSLLEYLNDKCILKNICRINLDEAIIPHGNRDELLEEYGLKGKKLIERIEDFIYGEKK